MENISMESAEKLAKDAGLEVRQIWKGLYVKGSETVYVKPRTYGVAWKHKVDGNWKDARIITLKELEKKFKSIAITKEE